MRVMRIRGLLATHGPSSPETIAVSYTADRRLLVTYALGDVWMPRSDGIRNQQEDSGMGGSHKVYDSWYEELKDLYGSERTVTAWCREHAISQRTCYYRRKVLARLGYDVSTFVKRPNPSKAARPAVASQNEISFVEIQFPAKDENEVLPAAPSAVAAPDMGMTPDIVIQYHGAVIALGSEFTEESLGKVMRVLRDA